MGSGENQGLQIALIILFVLIVLLSVATFTLFTQNQQYDQALQAMTKERDDAKSGERQLLENVRSLKEWIGLDPNASDDKLETASQAFKDDIAKFAGSLPAEKQKYRFALEEAMASVNVANEKTIQFTEQIKQLETVNKQYEEAAKKQVEEALAAKKKAEDDLANQLVVFQDAQKKAEDEKKNLVAQLDTVQKQVSEATDASKVEVEKRDKQIGVLEGENRKQKDIVKQLRGEYDIADDGEIRHVNARSRTVWINLGRLDALKPQVTFTVHSPEVPPGSPNATKAKIQVTQILGDHIAEARILEDSVTNPLIPGDKIYTALWDPGRTEHFFIAGRVSIAGEGDGLAQIRSMIGLAGGIIDGELDDKGIPTGAMTSQTRYLVLGEASVASKAKYDQLVKDAETLGVEAIGVDKFLDHVGWKSAPTGLRFGIGSNISNENIGKPDGGIPATTNTEVDQFKRRRPPETPAISIPKPLSAYK